MTKYLCCNADESEPGTFKDRELMFKNPHGLIEGIAISALAVDATYAFIFIRGEYWEVADVLDAAVREAYDGGYLGENILGSGHRVELVVHRGAGAYICGEETALLDSLEGKKGHPPEAAVPRDPGPLRRADADQQRRDADERAAHREPRRRVVRVDQDRAIDRDEGRVGLGARAAPGELRSRAPASPRGRSSAGSPAAPARGARWVWFPGGSWPRS